MGKFRQSTLPAKCGLRINASTHGGATHSNLSETSVRIGADVLDCAFHLSGVSKKFLAQTDRCRILQVRAPGLYHRHKLCLISLSGFPRALGMRRSERSLDLDQGGNVNSGWNGVIR